MPIELIVRAANGEGEKDYAEVGDYLRQLPDAHEEGNDFTFRDEEAGVFFVVMPGHAGAGQAVAPGPDDRGRCDRARVRVPNDLIPTTRKPLSEFVFSLTRRFGWQVYEEQTRFADEGALMRRLGGTLQPPGARGGCSALFALAGIALVIALSR